MPVFKAESVNYCYNHHRHKWRDDNAEAPCTETGRQK